MNEKVLENALTRYFYESYANNHTDSNEVRRYGNTVSEKLAGLGLNFRQTDDLIGDVWALAGANELQGFINGYKYAIIMTGR